jgi:hypothetical protein
MFLPLRKIHWPHFQCFYITKFFLSKQKPPISKAQSVVSNKECHFHYYFLHGPKHGKLDQKVCPPKIPF